MLTRTFRMQGIGPSRERELWARGVRTWEDLPDEGLVLSPKLDDKLRRHVDELRDLLAGGELVEIARRLPLHERWRMWPWLRDATCFLDIEGDGEREPMPTSVALLTPEGPKLFVDGFGIEALHEELPRHTAIVTFGGSQFDLPVLCRAFPGLQLPPVHLDLRSLFRRLGEPGGLKKLEARFGLTRPGSVEGVGGYEAVLLWRRWREERDVDALVRLAEYNLYDAIQLRPLLDLAYNRGVDECSQPAEKVPVFERGDVLYDVTKLVLELRDSVRT